MQGKFIVTILSFAALSFAAYATDPADIDGAALETQFSKEGIGDRAHIDITKDDLYQVFMQDSLQLLFNEGSQFAAPITIREVHAGERSGYSIDGMALKVDQRGAVVQAVVPIGSGTIYEFFGKVELFGNTLATDGETPLVFLVHNAHSLDQLKPNFRTNGKLTAIPLYPPLKAVAQKAPANLPSGVLLQLVHIRGNGMATLKDGSKVVFKDSPH